MAKQSGGNTAQRVEALVRPVVEGMGLRLWDVVFEKEGPDWYLRVLIDRDGTMDTDTCAEVSHALDPSSMRQTHRPELLSRGGQPRPWPQADPPGALRGTQGREDRRQAHPPHCRRRARVCRHPERPRGSTVTVETENGPVSFEVNAASGVHLCDDEHLFD